MYREILEQEYALLCRQRLMDRVSRQPSLAIVWWNTSLCSYGRVKKGKTSKVYLETLKSIKKLLADNDLLILGEFTDEYGLRKYIAELNLRSVCEGSRVRYNMIDLNYSETYKNARNRTCKHEFHNVIIYKMNSLVYFPEAIKCMTCNKLGTKHYRVYQCVKFRSRSLCDKALEVFVVHWSMRDSINGEDEKRKKYDAAGKIRARMIDDESSCPYQIVVGDFNCEMYEEPFAKLESSRSVKYAARNNSLYNPFWRCVGDDVGSISDRGNLSLLCDEPFFDGILVNRGFVGEEGDFKLLPSVLNDVKPFRSGNHRPLQLIINKVK